MDGARAGVSAEGDKRALLLTNHQQALLRAVIHALHSKGIECHERMWQVASVVITPSSSVVITPSSATRGCGRSLRVGRVRGR